MKVKALVDTSYHYRRNFIVDNGNRLRLSQNVLDTISHRNQYNLRDCDFLANVDREAIISVLPDSGAKDFQISAEDQIDTSSLDSIIFLNVGRIDHLTPAFSRESADKVFIYCATDYQRLYWKIKTGEIQMEFAFRIALIDSQNRFVLNDLERKVAVGGENDRGVFLEGHPHLHCFTLSKPYLT